MVRQCPSCGGFCKESGCERENMKPERETRKWRGLQDKDLHFLWVSTSVKKINKDRYTLIARQIETYLKERNTHE